MCFHKAWEGQSPHLVRDGLGRNIPEAVVARVGRSNGFLCLPMTALAYRNMWKKCLQHQDTTVVMFSFGETN